MTTPERTVEEIVEEFKQFAGDLRKQNHVITHGRFPKDEEPQEDEAICIYCGVNADKILEKLTQTLEAERQIREVVVEVVEELETMRKYLLGGEPTGRVNMGGRGTSDYYQQGQLDVLETVIRKLTQTNNTK